ncbi:STAS domain-containing protein [Streptomyces violaceus]|uniref:STAS domain-containing protein n=1 Tax=Streptomyces violaceus TaxID=1936 RepID=UPI002E1CD09D
MDYDQAPELRRQVDQLPLTPGQCLVLDLSGLECCDSTGITALLAARQHALAAGAGIVLAGVRRTCCVSSRSWVSTRSSPCARTPVLRHDPPGRSAPSVLTKTGLRCFSGSAAGRLPGTLRTGRFEKEGIRRPCHSLAFTTSPFHSTASPPVRV